MFRYCELVRLLGLRGRGCRDRGDLVTDLQNLAVRRQLGGAGGGAVVPGADRCLGGGVYVAGAGRVAVGDDAVPCSFDAMVPVQVGESSRLLHSLVDFRLCVNFAINV